MRNYNLNNLVSEAIAIEQEEAKEAGTLGYMARILVQATIPHSNPHTNSFERNNGNLSLTILGHPKIGLPYGTYPRLLLSWVTTEAILTKNPILILGNNLSRFMTELGLIPTGGRWGTIWRLRDQISRLFSSSVACIYQSEQLRSGVNFSIAKEYHLWWNPKSPDQTDLWQSPVTLNQDFFNEIINRPVPINMRALKAIKDSSMAIDLYCWLTYRLSYLKQTTEIPWLLLQKQFGADYANTKQGRYKFKQKLITQLKKVAIIYDSAKDVTPTEHGLILLPGKSHI